MVATTQVARSILQLAMVATLSILGTGAGCTMATIEVIVGADTTRREVDGIQYQKSQPNGSKCDPTCYNSTVTISLGP